MKRKEKRKRRKRKRRHAIQQKKIRNAEKVAINPPRPPQLKKKCGIFNIFKIPQKGEYVKECSLLYYYYYYYYYLNSCKLLHPKKGERLSLNLPNLCIELSTPLGCHRSSHNYHVIFL